MIARIAADVCCRVGRQGVSTLNVSGTRIDKLGSQPGPSETFQFEPMLLGLPGLCWGMVLIGTEINAAEGWWLIGLTIATGAAVAIQHVGPDAHWLMSLLITIAIVAVVAALFVREPDGVVFVQPFVLGLNVIASNRSISRTWRLASIFVASLFDAPLLVMLLGAWGMSH